MKKNAHDLAGAIYPVPSDLANRFFLKETQNRIFVKYVAHNTTKLRPKNKIIFYASKGAKQLVGEGIIEHIEFLTPEEVLSKHRETLFLTEEEFCNYVKMSPTRSVSKKMLTIVFSKLRRYDKPIKYNKPMTMAGRYLECSEYHLLNDKKSGARE